MVNKHSNTQLKLVADSPPQEQESTDWIEIRRNRLINSLNRINFQDEEIILNFKHTKYNTILSVPALPQPCTDKVFHCQWTDPEFSENDLQSYKFEHFYFTDGLKKVLVEPELENITSEEVKFILPDTCIEVGSRKIRRYKCQAITAQLTQDGLILEGALINFSAVSFSVQISSDYKHNLQHLDQKSALNIILRKDSTFFYSGICEISRLSSSADDSLIIIV